MVRRGHGKTPFSITPENAIKKSRIGSIRPGEIHSGRFLRPLTRWGIHLVDETVVVIAPICGEGRLVAWAGEERSHNGSVAVILIHGWQAEQGLDGVHHIYRRVEAPIDKGMSS